MNGRCQGFSAEHRFEARFDTIPPDPTTMPMGDDEDPEDWVSRVKAATRKVYRGDVCTKCGATAAPADGRASGLSMTK